MSLVRKTPAKGVESLHPISDATRAIITRKTREDYQFAYQLPEKLNLSNCPDLVDVSALGGVKVLWLSGCRITDVSMLGRVEWLYLGGCTGVTDVSMLGGVKYLYLRGCTGITDFSMVPHARIHY